MSDVKESPRIEPTAGSENQAKPAKSSKQGSGLGRGAALSTTRDGKKSLSGRASWLVSTGIAVATLIGGFFLYPVVAPAVGLQVPLSVSNASADEILSGKVSLTETELINQVTLHNLVAYWIGPRAGYKYTISVTNDGQTYIKYLPNGDGIDKPNSDYVVIGTYSQKDAFDITAAAGSQENAVSFVNGDGAQVFYNKMLMSNVYLAYPDEDYEVEIYSPVSGDAVLYATTPGQVTLIR